MSRDSGLVEKKRKVTKTKLTKAAQKKAKARIRKQKPKKALKISGLDLLHSQTLQSTSDQMIGRRLPPAAGCRDERLASFAGTMIHEELEIPAAPSETPYGLKILLDVYKAQFMSFLESMKTNQFKDNLLRQIEAEKDKNKKLMNRTGQLEKQIKVLVDDSVVLLKARMGELGINTTSQNDLLCKAKEIVGKHKELQIMANKIQHQVTNLEEENNTIMAYHVKKLAEKNKQPVDFELASKGSHDLVLKEIDNTFNQRKNLKNRITSLEAELALIEKSNEEKRTTAAVLEAVTQTQAPQQKVVNTPGIYVSSNIYKSTPASTKASRKNREHRTKSHEWPDIPDVQKIEEKNPEILAQKILETGRQIEAGKLLANSQLKGKTESYQYQKKGNSHKGDNMSMPAPVISGKAAKNAGNALPKAGNSKKVHESHKVVNFEDRLKSIITSALQGQNEQVSGQQQQTQQQPVGPPPQQQQHQQQVVNIPKQQQQMMVSQTSGSPKKSNQQQQQQQSNYSGNIQSNWNVSGAHQPTNQHQQMLAIVAAGGAPHHLNASTTISPTQTSPIKTNRQMAQLPQMAPHLPQEHQQQPQLQNPEHNYGALKRNEHLPNFAKAMQMNPSDLNKMLYTPPSGNPAMIFQQQQQQQQQQNQNQYLQNQNQNQYLQNRESALIFQQRTVEDKREFKTPDNVRYDRQDMGRSSVGSIENEYINSGSNSSSNKSQTQRSSSSLSQPDYTQVSPAKLALRRHLSQEKLTHQSVAGGPQFTTKTVGDIINSEIERTLEISHQSIINAAVNSAAGSAGQQRLGNESVINCSMNQNQHLQDRDVEDHNYGGMATIKPTGKMVQQSQQQQQQQQSQQFSQDHYMQIDHQRRPKLLPQKYVNANSVRKSAINSPQRRHHDEYANIQKESREMNNIHQESSYKIDNKMFAHSSNIHMSLNRIDEPSMHISMNRRDEPKEKVQAMTNQQPAGPPLEGLAASLQAHVIAKMQIKEETESVDPRYPYSNIPYPHIVKKEGRFFII